ncbi:hypothetical protein IID24_04205, partial [Patescibacteria group bacterium]|nr:hypothetical protein [Patescibacteria group bacterium]
ARFVDQINTSDWQTYRNEELGFEVKRPTEWIVENTNVVNPKSGSSFEITKNENSDNLSLDEWFRQATMISGRPTVKAAAERTIINGMPAYMLETELSPPNPLFEVVAIANSQSNIFSIYAYYEVQEDIETLNQILSTFRFIEKDSSSSDTVLTPQEVLSDSGAYDGKEIQVIGIIELIPFVDEFGLGGASPGFKTEIGNLAVSNWDHVYSAAQNRSEVLVRGVFDVDNNFLSFANDCVGCFLDISPQP